MRLNVRLFLCILALHIFTQCSDDDPVRAPSTLVQSTSLFVRDAAELQTYLNASSFDLPAEELKFDVEVFKVTYKTSYNGEEIIASGLVILPETTDEIGIVSFQHGTISAHVDAPSQLPLSDPELILYSALASPGFIAVIPDYLGFGESSSVRHPYYDETNTASAVLDLVKAGRELATAEGKIFNGKLFLAGYSQGGYATMAAHKAFEENPINGISLVASYPAAGGYDVKGMQEAFFAKDEYHYPSYLAYVASAYSSTYNWSEPLSELFHEPYASKIPDLFDGSKTMGEINEELTTDVHLLLQADAIENFETDAKYETFRNALIENSLLDWTPNVPMHMYHGTADITVFYQNSVATYDQLIANGALPSVVTLTDLPGADHASGIVPYIEMIIPDIISNR